MASPLAHALVGAAVYAVMAPRDAPLRRVLPWALAALAGAAADLDFVPGILVGDPSRYHHWATHSLAAALVFASVVGPLAPARLGTLGQRTAILGVAYASHLGLDLLTIDHTLPQGIPLFWPISTAVFLAPVTPFWDLYHGRGWAAFVNWHNAIAVLIEAVVVGVPVVALCVFRLRREGRTTVGARRGFAKDSIGDLGGRGRREAGG
jgi:membrane-bound metal-dependent hydrolase YbcI (DUF457 family)